MKKKITFFLIAFIPPLVLFHYFPFGYVLVGNQESSTGLNINKTVLIRQGYNQCGPAAAMVLINIYTNKIIDLNTINDQMIFRLSNNMTYPWGITDYLNKHEIPTRIKSLKLLTKKQKIKYIKQRLTEKRPIIILNKTQGVLHYFTLLGYNKNEFYIYDSLQPQSNDGLTLDSNGSNPGNITLEVAELLSRWENGKYSFINFILIEPKVGAESTMFPER